MIAILLIFLLKLFVSDALYDNDGYSKHLESSSEKSIHVISSFYANPYLSLADTTKQLYNGPGNLKVEVPPAADTFLWEYTGFYKATESGYFTFSTFDQSRGVIQFGFQESFGHAYETLRGLGFQQTVSRTPLSLSTGVSVQLSKGEFYPIRAVIRSRQSVPIFISSASQTRHEITRDIFQFRYDSKDSGSSKIEETGNYFSKGDSTDASRLFSQSGFNVSCFSRNENQFTESSEMYLSGLRKINEANSKSISVDSSVHEITVPEAIEIVGYIQPTFSGTHKFAMSESLIASLQIGPGKTEKKSSYFLDQDWHIMDTRVSQSTAFSLSLDTSLVYPFRFVVLGKEENFKYDIVQLNPKDQEQDLLGVWQSISDSKEVSDIDFSSSQKNPETSKKSDSKVSTIANDNRKHCRLFAYHSEGNFRTTRSSLFGSGVAPSATTAHETFRKSSVLKTEDPSSLPGKDQDSTTEVSSWVEATIDEERLPKTSTIITSTTSTSTSSSTTTNTIPSTTNTPTSIPGLPKTDDDFVITTQAGSETTGVFKTNYQTSDSDSNSSPSGMTILESKSFESTTSKPTTLDSTASESIGSQSTHKYSQQASFKNSLEIKGNISLSISRHFAIPESPLTNDDSSSWLSKCRSEMRLCKAVPAISVQEIEDSSFESYSEALSENSLHFEAAYKSSEVSDVTSRSQSKTLSFLEDVEKEKSGGKVKVVQGESISNAKALTTAPEEVHNNEGIDNMLGDFQAMEPKSSYSFGSKSEMQSSSNLSTGGLEDHDRVQNSFGSEGVSSDHSLRGDGTLTKILPSTERVDEKLGESAIEELGQNALGKISHSGKEARPTINKGISYASDFEAKIGSTLVPGSDTNALESKSGKEPEALGLNKVRISESMREKETSAFDNPDFKLSDSGLSDSQPEPSITRPTTSFGQESISVSGSNLNQASMTESASLKISSSYDGAAMKSSINWDLVIALAIWHM